MPRFSSIILLSIGSAAAAALAGHGADAYAPRLDCETYSEWVPGEPFGFMGMDVVVVVDAVVVVVLLLVVVLTPPFQFPNFSFSTLLFSDIQ